MDTYGLMEKRMARGAVLENLRYLVTAKGGATNRRNLECLEALAKYVLDRLGLDVALDSDRRADLLEAVLPQVAAHARLMALDQLPHVGSYRDTQHFQASAAGELMGLTDEQQFVKMLHQYALEKELNSAAQKRLQEQINGDLRHSARSCQRRASVWVVQTDRNMRNAEVRDKALEALIDEIATFLANELARDRVIEISNLTDPRPESVDSGNRTLPQVDEVRSSQRTRARKQPPIAPKLAHVIDDLADLIRRQLQEDQRFDDAHASTPIRIRLSDRGHSLQGKEERTQTLLLPSGPASVADLARHVAELFGSAPIPHTLFLLGKRGSGKSFFVRELALTLLQGRHSGDSIPVIFNVSSWNPVSKTLGVWIADQLIEGYPNLKKKQRRLGTLASQLVNSHCVLPILDGFDEIAPKLRATAIREISKYVSRGGALMVTSRPQEYLEAASSAAHPMGATYVQIDDLTSSDVANYLSTGSNVTAVEWNRLLDKKGSTSSRSVNSALQEALTTPLMVSLAKAIYGVDRTVEPSELLDPESFPAKEAIERHLLGRFIEAKYSHRPQDPDVSQIQNYDPETAGRWLGFIATCMIAGKTREFVWWRPRARLLTVPSILISGLLAAVGAMLVLTYAAEADYVFHEGIPTTSLSLNVALASCIVVGVGALLGNYASPTTIPPDAPETARRLTRFPISAFPEGVVTIASFEIVFLLTAQLGDITHLDEKEGLFNSWIFIALLGSLLVDRPFRVYYSSIDVADPRALFNRDVKASLLRAGASGAAIAILFILLWRSRGYLDWGTVVPALFFASTVSTFLASASGSWLLRVTTFSAFGLLPRRCLFFLEDARRRGILRQSGGVYQFKHALLRDRLAIDFMADDNRLVSLFRIVRVARASLAKSDSRRDLPPS